jgi:hypothetical protein
MSDWKPVKKTSKRRERPFFVGAHQAAISSNVGRKNRGKSAFDLLT